MHGPAPQWSADISLDLMDRYGIETAITSFGPSGFWFGDIEETKTLTRRCNEYAARLKHDRPGRFGDAKIGIQQMPELLAVPGIDVVGPLPAEIQVFTRFRTTVLRGAQRAEMAMRFVRCLTGPAAVESMRCKGMEPVPPT